MIQMNSRFYDKLVQYSNLLQNPLLLFLRLYWGVAFAFAGWGKLSNIEPVIGAFTDLSIPLPNVNAYLVGGTEFFGGIFLVLGLLSRLMSIPLAFTMIVAYSVAHTAELVQFFSNPQAFIGASPLTFLLVSLIVLAFGPGKYALDYLFGLEKGKDGRYEKKLNLF